jgi:Tol biopolymer transport system component
MNEDGSHVTKVLSVGGYLYSWSPDGSSVSYNQGLGSTTNRPLYRFDIVIVDGNPKVENHVKLLDCYPCDSEWSPVGDEIVFVSDELTDELQVIPATGGTATTIFTAAAGEDIRYPSWSSDGSQIAFRHRDTVGTYSIKVIDSATGLVTATLASGYTASGLEWAKTQNLVAFASGGIVYTVDVATDTVTLITEGSFPSWSPDDGKIAAWKAGGGEGDIWTHEFSSGDEERLVKRGRYAGWKRA